MQDVAGYSSAGLCSAITKHQPQFYFSGISTLAFMGGVETTACYWNHILSGKSYLANKATPRQVRPS